MSRVCEQRAESMLSPPDLEDYSLVERLNGRSGDHLAAQMLCGCGACNVLRALVRLMCFGQPKIGYLFLDAIE